MKKANRTVQVSNSIQITPIPMLLNQFSETTKPILSRRTCVVFRRMKIQTTATTMHLMQIQSLSICVCKFWSGCAWFYLLPPCIWMAHNNIPTNLCNSNTNTTPSLKCKHTQQFYTIIDDFVHIVMVFMVEQRWRCGKTEQRRKNQRQRFGVPMQFYCERAGI